ncbi:uncharacterized protein LOC110944447 [Helianthus annuus]|uniref:uncharacterized protein LOC110944447 n=1 Tax=Helianthus annuus TaxID=4232 RepID=UPI000B909A08|nr:uncharacterized protein LOC110944447 [Helianthus annuus]
MEVWHNIRNRDNPVSWVNMVWFGQCIPRHSFHLWLVIKNKLRTQDRLRVWEAGSETNLRLMCCPLCQHDRDSRDHLFFSCDFASQVWREVRAMVDMDTVSGSWVSILEWMERYSNSNTLDRVVCKLVIAAAAYYIWQERNNRLFNRSQGSVSQIAEKIKHTVQLRLMDFKLQKRMDYKRVVTRWQIPERVLIEDPG